MDLIVVILLRWPCEEEDKEVPTYFDAVTKSLPACRHSRQSSNGYVSAACGWMTESKQKEGPEHCESQGAGSPPRGSRPLMRRRH